MRKMTWEFRDVPLLENKISSDFEKLPIEEVKGTFNYTEREAIEKSEPRASVLNVLRRITTGRRNSKGLKRNLKRLKKLIFYDSRELHGVYTVRVSRSYAYHACDYVYGRDDMNKDKIKNKMKKRPKNKKKSPPSGIMTGFVFRQIRKLVFSLVAVVHTV